MRCQHCAHDFEPVEVIEPHRVMCGDSTSAEDVEALLDGATPGLMVTDPPYGVQLDPAWRDRSGANSMAHSGGGGEAYTESCEGDTEARWDEVWKLSPAEVFYVWCASSRLIEVEDALREASFVYRQLLIWDKTVATMTRTHYWFRHEPCLYGVKKGRTASWIGKAGQPTVWEIPSPKHIMSGSDEENEPHPAQKPVECMARPIRNHDHAEVFDPFLGSGTTLVAADQLNRTCYGMEKSPQFVDVIVRRWIAYREKQGLAPEVDGWSEDDA